MTLRTALAQGTKLLEDGAIDAPRLTAEVLLAHALRVARAEALSVTDDLTQLYNARFLHDALRKEAKRSVRSHLPLSLLFVDLDGFKRINDAHGHLLGSRALVEAAAVIRGSARETDIVARYGGDEFALLIFNPSAAGLDELRERLSEALLKSGIQASIGSALSEPQATLEQTWAKADASMYAVKTAAPTPTAS